MSWCWRTTGTRVHRRRAPALRPSRDDDRVMPTRQPTPPARRTCCSVAAVLAPLTLVISLAACGAPATPPVAPTPSETRPCPAKPDPCVTVEADPRSPRGQTNLDLGGAGDVAPLLPTPSEPALAPPMKAELEAPVLPPATRSRRARLYDRRQWRHWVDDDGDCQDTRTEVLVTESEVPVTYVDARHCKVLTGRWTCPYTGKVITDPHLLDVDHVVALGNAARSGGDLWEPRRKQAYANDVADPAHLVAVDRSANRAKGDRGPEVWLPPRVEFRCAYLRTWVTIKKRWGLAMAVPERYAIAAILATCPPSPHGVVHLVPAPSGPRPRPARSRSPAGSRPPSQAPSRCSVVCRAGCPCGHGCISCAHSCRRPPGRACASSASATRR
jgi:hypothetical protein